MNSIVMKNFVSFAHALADETRLRIVHLLMNEPLCVCELADVLEMPQSSVSSHVQVIKKSGMLDSERCEKWVYYRLSPAYRHLFMSMSGFFEISAASDAVLKADAKKAVKRLAQRDDSCCPTPRELKKLKPLTQKRVSRATA